MNVEVIERKGLKLKILFRDAPPHVLAAIRRAAIEYVPTMAVDYLLILENDSVLHDEVLAHRIGLIPLTSDKALEKYKLPEECSEEEQEKCAARLYLEARNEDSDEMIVYSEHLKPEDPDVKPVYDKIPIVVLGRGQSVVAEVIARLGRGREHIKWSPVSVSVLLNVPQVEFDLTKATKEEVSQCLECIKSYSSELADEIKRRKKGSIKILNFRNTSLLRYCEERACREIVKINYLDNERILYIESSGSLKPENIVKLAFKELVKKLDKLESKIKELGGVSD